MCFLWVIRSIDKELLSNWWFTLSITRLDALLNVLDLCVSCFEYRVSMESIPLPLQLQREKEEEWEREREREGEGGEGVREGQGERVREGEREAGGGAPAPCALESTEFNTTTKQRLYAS